MMATTRVLAIDPFNYERPEQWPQWISRFERGLVIEGKSTQPDSVKVDWLVYCLGSKAEDIFVSFQLSDAKVKYDVVKLKFEQHFISKRNIIFERAQFNMRKQLEGEPVQAFITDLFTKAEHLQYGALKDEMIRDRIVIGLLDEQLSQKLQLQADLTLTRAVEMCRQSETVKAQQKVLHRSSELEFAESSPIKVKMENIAYAGHSGNYDNRITQKALCGNCGKRHGSRFYAEKAKCRDCGNVGHYARVCPNKGNKQDH